MALGREVGIPGRYLQQALLEERTRAGRDRAPGVSSASRVRPGLPPSGWCRGDRGGRRTAVCSTGWSRNELLCVQRQQAGRITWEPLGGFRRRSAGRPPRSERQASFHAIPCRAPFPPPYSRSSPGYSHVALAADARRVRGDMWAAAPRWRRRGGRHRHRWSHSARCSRCAPSTSGRCIGVGYAVVRRYRPAVERFNSASSGRSTISSRAHPSRASVSGRRPGLSAYWPTK